MCFRRMKCLQRLGAGRIGKESGESLGELEAGCVLWQVSGGMRGGCSAGCRSTKSGEPLKVSEGGWVRVKGG